MPRRSLSGRDKLIRLSGIGGPPHWHARTISGPPPAALLHQQAKARARIAAGSRQTWEAWPDRAAPDLAARLGVAEQAAAGSLREVVAAELDRCQTEALTAARSAFGL
jgi:2-oxo-4-hydroxy-4-carboxy--5-ureidoimidazoline (OHCU) decarboxylase